MKKGERVHVTGDVTVNGKTVNVDVCGTMMQNTVKNGKFVNVMLDKHDGKENVVAKVPVRRLKRI